jgi:hypothetical protein
VTDTLGTQETVALLLHITDVAEVLLVQVQSHGLLVTVGRTSYQRGLEISSGRRRLRHHQSPSTDNSHQEALRA